MDLFLTMCRCLGGKISRTGRTGPSTQKMGSGEMCPRRKKENPKPVKRASRKAKGLPVKLRKK